MVLTDDQIRKIARISSDLVEGFIYENWEGTGMSCFDPYGEYQKELAKQIADYLADNI